MRFLVLLAEADHFDKWDAADEAFKQRNFDDYDAFATKVRKEGTLVVGDALHRPDQARTLQPLDRTVTRGPYAETAEQVGGFYVIDMPDLESAVAAAALLPRELTVEVRPTLGVTV